MRGNILVVALAAVLLFGCFGIGGGGGTTPTATPYNGGGATPTATPYNGGGATPTPTPHGGGLAGLGWEAILALGTPVQCTVISEGQTWNMKIRGDTFRAEADTVSDGQTTHVLMIMKDGFGYIQATDQMRQMPGTEDCAWLKMEQTESNDTGTEMGVEDYSTVPPENISCVPAVFGDEAFATPGRACALADFMQFPTPGPNGDVDACAYCAMIQDAGDRAECLQYCNQ